MKIFILTLIATFVLTLALSAKSVDDIKLRGGQQKTTGELTVKFVSVEEDSRCPANAQCIWAGNARIKIKVTGASWGSKVLELNTNLEPRGEQFGGYAINLTGLTQPGDKASASRYVATLSVKRLVR